jgi:thioredoxin 1
MEVDPNRSVVAQYKVAGVPAFRLFREGEMIAALEGAVVKQKLLDLLNPYVPA